MSIKKLNINFFIFIYLSFLSLSYRVVRLKDFVPFLSYLLERDRRISYLYSESTKYRIGFRADFALFNTSFLFIFLFINKKTKDDQYKDLLIYYILSSCVFFFFFLILYFVCIFLFIFFLIIILFFLFFCIFILY